MRRTEPVFCWSRDGSYTGIKLSFKEEQLREPVFAGVCHSDCDSLKLMHINLPNIQLSMKISWRANLPPDNRVDPRCLLSPPHASSQDQEMKEWSSSSLSVQSHGNIRVKFSLNQPFLFCQLGIIGSEVLRWLVFTLWFLSGICFVTFSLEAGLVHWSVFSPGYGSVKTLSLDLCY